MTSGMEGRKPFKYDDSRYVQIKRPMNRPREHGGHSIYINKIRFHLNQFITIGSKPFHSETASLF
jgi:hypothetical protein